ncbi:MAG: OmpA family protein [Azoarcus sp.]|jgi:outer membrane protein OmpA-like peptidoglycan-associated protein|nr:OmpA family protein [Azoarcus sp.]
MNKIAITCLIVVFCVANLPGCANMGETERSTGTGAAIGAIVGGVLGRATAGGNKGRSTATGAVIGAAVGAGGGYLWSRQMQKQKEDMEQATQGTGINVTQTEDNQLKLEIPTDVSFDTGRYNIKPALRPILNRFAVTLNENLVTQVTIIGHTDNTGSDAINDPLSVNRAASARNYLTARGVEVGRILIDGRGSYEPIASNDTVAGRAMNRRVEIYVAEAVN